MSSRRIKLYKCPVCDTVVEVLRPCGLEIVCCGPTMIEMTEDDRPDDHLPLVEWSGQWVSARPRISHVSDDEHRIVWMEIRSGQTCYRRFFEPGQEPEIRMRLSSADRVVVKLYCNQHGLWRTVSLRPEPAQANISSPA